MTRIKLFLFVILSLAFSVAYTQTEVGDATLGERDPFKRPKYIDDLEIDIPTTDGLDGKNIDETTDAIRRWPLKMYKPIAVIWDVQSPKVMILDPNKTMHLLKKNYRIGNQNGLITSINEGEIVVTENGIPNVIKIVSSESSGGK